MNIAIASSGLGHVSRGIETWAADLAGALHAAGIPATLFSAAPTNSAFRVQHSAFSHVIPCWKRTDPTTLRLLKFTRRGGWRIGLGSPYDIEQTTFALTLIPHLRRQHIDILHVQDPQLALLIQRAQKLGLVKTRTILAHGTEEPPAFLHKITYLQHLAPWHLEDTKAAGIHKPTWTSIPNFIDTDTFCPTQHSELRTQNSELRNELHIPQDAPVVLTVAAIKRAHKRIDHLLSEFAALLEKLPTAHLIIAGGHETETDDLIREGKQRLGDRVTFLVRFPRNRMPDLYRAADVFVLCSLKEMMPIALIEATASGLPCLVHPHPVMQWMIGPGGISTDMATPGTLAENLRELLLNPAHRNELANAARRHCVENFGKDRVVQQILNYYHFVLTHDQPSAQPSSLITQSS